MTSGEESSEPDRKGLVMVTRCADAEATGVRHRTDDTGHMSAGQALATRFRAGVIRYRRFPRVLESGGLGPNRWLGLSRTLPTRSESPCRYD